MQILCRLDKAIYSAVSPDITTDEVIITEERIGHIKAHHPNDYERFSAYIPLMITEPDYLVEANRPKTAVVMKRVCECGENFKLILRLKTSTDESEYKNSVISFMRIRENDWERILKNHKILYESIDKTE